MEAQIQRRCPDALPFAQVALALGISAKDLGWVANQGLLPVQRLSKVDGCGVFVRHEDLARFQSEYVFCTDLAK